MKTKSKAEFSRFANMRAIRSKDTSLELLVRKVTRTISTGYRLHRKDIPGKPDLAWIGRRQAVFVDGCFWRGHDCKHGALAPKVNRDYWTAKIGRNGVRDSANLRQLEALGKSALTLWECELGDETQVHSRLSAFLSTH